METIEILQGKTIMNPAHYDYQEQFFCSIEGNVQLKLIPPIYHQEVYAGKPKLMENVDGDIVENTDEKMEPNYSPVNFFIPDYKIYPLLDLIEKRYTIFLRSGDCVYIPAYYFH